MTESGTIINRYEKALSSGDLNVIQEIVSELNAVEPKDKEPMRQFYAKIEEDLFAIGLEPPKNFDLRNYDNAIQIAKSAGNKSEKTKVTGNRNALVLTKDINDVFMEFHAQSEKIFNDLKYHFIFHLNNPKFPEIGILILTDDKFVDNPLIEKIFQLNVKARPQKFTIRQFLDEIIKQPSLVDSQYLLLLVISPSLGETNSIKELQEGLFSKFQNCYLISATKTGRITRDDYMFKVVDRVMLDNIEKISGNMLNNKAITHEEEKIIKLCLSKNTAITDYRILKEGFSGAKVIEVKPIRYVLSQEPVRFVIKFAFKTSERKLYAEKEAFKRCVQELRVDSYSCEYVETDLCEAILYNYASSDSVKDSISFSALIDDSLVQKPKYTHDLMETLNQLFSCPVFVKWSSSALEKKKPVTFFYKKYLEEEKICEQIALIENKELADVKNSSLWLQYEKIMNFSFTTKEKLCHGDLHTENFFKDEKDVYLIDFGYTCENHAIIDHSTLEASIKFKHIPRFVPVSDLVAIEKKFYKDDSFTTAFNLEFIERPKVRQLFKLVLHIRNNALQFMNDPADKLEYLISLFILTFRQIQYRDLNQRYALESAKSLGDFIVGLIS